PGPAVGGSAGSSSTTMISAPRADACGATDRSATASASRRRRVGNRIEAGGRRTRPRLRPVILLLHNRYRLAGGEERAVQDLMWLIREHLGEDVELLERDSATLGRGRAAVALLRGGLAPDDVAHAVRRTRARVVPAHNLT